VLAQEDLRERDAQLRYEGAGLIGAPGGFSLIEFESLGVELVSWLPLNSFDSYLSTTVTRASDIWGYVSPLGREYAIIGLGEGVGFVEVTTPATPTIIDAFGGPTTKWRDIKTYRHYAYVVADFGVPNLLVFDLSDIDNGNVTLESTIVTSSTHNVAIDATSGFLYRLGAGAPDARGLMIYDLNAFPDNPQLVGEWNDRYIHDAQAVTYTEGPYQDRQIVFAFSDDGGDPSNPALVILDVTEKSNIVLLSTLTYPNSGYSHQGWLSPDKQYVYLGDEWDEIIGSVPSTTTRVIDVSDPNAPFLAATFTNGNAAIDHNLFTRKHLIFEANYRSGLRVFDATNPLSPVEIAYFDTYPTSDSPNFNGLWGCYPYLPSGIVLGSDIEKGLFLWDVQALSEVIPKICGDTGTVYLDADMTGDCYVNKSDYVHFASFWNQMNCNESNHCGGADQDMNGIVDLLDLLIFVTQWLNCTDPPEAACYSYWDRTL
ncbi:MAG: choice-of-anchor B family protein, partial [Planctomycetes bacterium]|nr:choice-of-anchor B family protein [Planctomycetota bacterium]